MCSRRGCFEEHDDKTVYLEWTIIEKSVSLQISEGNPLVSGDWIASSMRSKKRKKLRWKILMVNIGMSYPEKSPQRATEGSQH